MKSIFLIGFMGSGKSSVGKQLAETLHLRWIDTDTEIERIRHKKISDIFQEQGEATFRLYESQVLEKMPVNDHIISTGGGIIENPQNTVWMRKHGQVILLQSSFEEIAKRLMNDHSRPLWNTNLDDKQNLYYKRLPIYQNAAHFVVNTEDREIVDIVEEIVSVIN